MDQGWKRLPLLVIVLLFWRNCDGFRGGTYQWGQLSDTFSPRAVQSSMSEANVPGISSEEVGSSVFPNQPLKSKSKFNLLQFVKGGSSSSQSVSNAQTAPSSLVSAALPLPLNELPLSSLTSAGSTIPDGASGLSLSTQYTASGSGPIVSTQGGNGNYPAKFGVPGSYSGLVSQGTSPFAPASSSASVSMSPPQTVVGPVKSPQSQLTSTLFTGTQGGSSTRFTLQGSATYGGSPQPQDAASQFAPSSSYVYSPYVKVPLSLPQDVASQASSQKVVTSSSGTKKQWTSSFTGTSGTQAGSSTPFTLQGSATYGGSPQPQDAASQFAPSSSYVYSPYVKVPLSSPQDVASQASSQKVVTSSSGTKKQWTSSFTGTQGGSSTPFTLQGSATYGGSPQPQDAASQFAPSSSYVYSPYVKVPLSSPQDVASQASSQKLVTSSSGTKKQWTSSFTGTSGTQAGSSTPFTLQGSATYGGSPQPQDAASQFAPSSSYVYSPYVKVPLSSPQDVASQASSQKVVTSSSGTKKQWTSSFTGTQGGSSTPFTLQGSASYGGSPQPQDAASQFAPSSSYVYSPYVKVPLSSPQDVASQASSQKVVTSSSGTKKQWTSSFTGTSGTQAGSSTPFTLQGGTAYGGSPLPKKTVSLFAPVSQSSSGSVSLSSPQAVAGPTAVQGSRKQFTPAYQGSSGAQFGTSTDFGSGVSSRYTSSVQSQGAASQFAPGSLSSYPGLSLSSPQTAAGPIVQGSRKQLTSTFTGMQAGSAYGGSPQPQDAASPLAPGSSFPYVKVSLSPQGVASQSSSQKLFTSASQASSGTPKQWISSFTGTSVQGSTGYGGLPQPKKTGSLFVPVSQSSSGSVSLSSPQAVASPTAVQSSRKQLASTYVGSSGTQAASSTPFNLQGSIAYGESPQLQDTASQFAPGSPSYSGSSLSPPQTVAGPTAVLGSRKQFTSTFTGGSGTQAGSSAPFTLQGSTAYGESSQPQDTASQLVPGGSTSYVRETLTLEKAKYTPGSQLLPYDQSVASKDASSASASVVSSRYSSMYNPNAPAQPSRSSSSSRFSVKG